MPWMPDVFTAPIAEARRAGEVTRANDAVPYYEGIMADEPGALVRSYRRAATRPERSPRRLRGRREAVARLRIRDGGVVARARRRGGERGPDAHPHTYGGGGRAAPARGPRRTGGAAGGRRERAQPRPHA